VTDERLPAGGVIAGLAMTGVMVAASVLTLGIPNLSLAGQFLGGSYPTVASAVALCSLVCYVMVTLAVALALAGALRRRAGWWARGRTLRAVTLVAAGAVLLGLSVASRFETGAGICCGSGSQQIQEVASLAR
jgi:hypothetical protein